MRYPMNRYTKCIDVQVIIYKDESNYCDCVCCQHLHKSVFNFYILLYFYVSSTISM
jgi:hypothetical protein